MKRLTVLTLGIGMLAMSAPIAAHATHAGYRGGCGFSVDNDTTSGGQLGGQEVWNGEVHLVVAATDSSANQLPMPYSLTASCELKVNGVSQGTVIGPVSGIGAVVDADTIQFTAAVTDLVSVCVHVTVDGENDVHCIDNTQTPVLPPVANDVLHQFLLNPALSALDTYCPSELDPLLSPVVDALGANEENGDGGYQPVTACGTIVKSVAKVHDQLVCFALEAPAATSARATRRAD